MKETNVVATENVVEITYSEAMATCVCSQLQLHAVLVL